MSTYSHRLLAPGAAQKLPKIKAEFVNLRRISLPVELEIKDWKAFERIYRPKGTPEEAKKLPTDNIAVRTDEEETMFEIPEIGYLNVKLGVGWSQKPPVFSSAWI